MENMTIVTPNQTLIHKAGAFFQSCIAFPNETNQRDGFSQVLENAGFPQWPLLPNSTEDANCSNIKELLSHLGPFPLFDVAIRTRSKKKILIIYEDNSYKYSVRRLKDDKRVIQDAIKLMIPDASQEEISNLTDSIVDITKNLTALTSGYREKSSEEKIGLLEEKFTNIPILEMLNNEFSKVAVNLTENDTVYVSPITYYEKLNGFLETVDWQALYNYGGFKALYQHAPDLWDMLKTGQDHKPKTPRWETCLHKLWEAMPEPANYTYAVHSFGSEAKAEATYIAEKIKAELIEAIRNSTWAENSSVRSLIKEVEKIQIVLGYSDNLLNQTILESLYKHVPDLNVTSSFLEIFDTLRENHHRNEMAELLQEETNNGVSVVKKRLTYDYCDDGARIELPMGLFQPPFYEKGLPWSVNFGGFGSFFGHVLIHTVLKKGLSTGNQYGLCTKFGKDNTSYIEFKNRTKCFMEQYRALTEPVYYHISDASVERSESECMKDVTSKYYQDKFPEFLRYTLGGNIADNEGVKLAFRAYEEVLNEECQNIDTRLEGFRNTSGKQLFFLGSAMAMCGAMNDSGLHWWMLTFQHSPYMYRVNISMQNSGYFAEAFGCSTNSSMYKEEDNRCSLW
ncbi:endothelin-converting enzyme 1-like [Amblyomma americanum]